MGKIDLSSPSCRTVSHLPPRLTPHGHLAMNLTMLAGGVGRRDHGRASSSEPLFDLSSKRQNLKFENFFSLFLLRAYLFSLGLRLLSQIDTAAELQ